MSTEETVFHLLDTIPLWENEERTINPLEIGIHKSKYNLKTKCYIPYLEDCSICFDKISHKKNAILTDCGHAFHRSCLVHYHDTLRKQKFIVHLKCPLCRTNIGNPLFYERYNSYCKEYNAMDNLENYWLYEKDYTLIRMCPLKETSSSPFHYLGMNHQCTDCQKYRQTGQV